MANSSTDFITDLKKSTAGHIADAIHMAYERGLSDGRRIASEQFKERLANVLMDPPVPSSDTVAFQGQVGDGATRAPRGSVEPAILDALRNAPRGKKPSEIAAEQNIPENSVRGKLNKLRSEERVHKVGEYWYITGSIPPKVGMETPAS